MCKFPAQREKLLSLHRKDAPRQQVDFVLLRRLAPPPSWIGHSPNLPGFGRPCKPLVPHEKLLLPRSRGGHSLTFEIVLLEGLAHYPDCSAPSPIFVVIDIVYKRPVPCDRLQPPHRRGAPS